MPEEESVDIKFRLYDGSDIGPFRYSAASTVDFLKQRVVSDWPKGFLYLLKFRFFCKNLKFVLSLSEFCYLVGGKMREFCYLLFGRLLVSLE